MLETIKKIYKLINILQIPIIVISNVCTFSNVVDPCFFFVGGWWWA